MESRIPETTGNKGGFLVEYLHYHVMSTGQLLIKYGVSDVWNTRSVRLDVADMDELVNGWVVVSNYYT